MSYTNYSTNIGKLFLNKTGLLFYERSEHVILGTIELLLEASYGNKERKIVILERASVKLNVLRFLIRLMKETRTFDLKKYTILESTIDEIGRMTGGWMRSINK